jgi:hypothetical protein
LARGHRDVLVEQVVHAVCAQSPATCIGEQWLILGAQRLANPGGQHGAGALAQRRAAFLAPFADHANMGSGAEVQVLAA